MAINESINTHTFDDLAGVFRKKYPQLKGEDWVRRLEPEDLEFFIHIGLAAGNYGSLGGKARAKQAKRDYRGRFIREEQEK